MGQEVKVPPVLIFGVILVLSFHIVHPQSCSSGTTKEVDLCNSTKSKPKNLSCKNKEQYLWITNITENETGNISCFSAQRNESQLCSYVRNRQAFLCGSTGSCSILDIVNMTDIAPCEKKVKTAIIYSVKYLCTAVSDSQCIPSVKTTESSQSASEHLHTTSPTPEFIQSTEDLSTRLASESHEIQNFTILNSTGSSQSTSKHLNTISPTSELLQSTEDLSTPLGVITFAAAVIGGILGAVIVLVALLTLYVVMKCRTPVNSEEPKKGFSSPVYAIDSDPTYIDPVYAEITQQSQNAPSPYETIPDPEVVHPKTPDPPNARPNIGENDYLVIIDDTEGHDQRDEDRQRPTSEIEVVDNSDYQQVPNENGQQEPDTGIVENPDYNDGTGTSGQRAPAEVEIEDNPEYHQLAGEADYALPTETDAVGYSVYDNYRGPVGNYLRPTSEVDLMENSDYGNTEDQSDSKVRLTSEIDLVENSGYHIPMNESEDL